MKVHKIRITLLTLISFLSGLFLYLIYLYGNEKVEKSKNDIDSSSSGDDEKVDINKNSQILFETKEYIVYKKIKRNQQVFTQGLFFDEEDTLIESGGLYGQSLLQKFKAETPDEKIFKIPLERKYFAEGACLFNKKVYQLTWQERVIFVYDYEKLLANPQSALEKTIPLPKEIKEGWGITNSKDELIISDGSDQLFFIDPHAEDFKLKRTIRIKDLNNIYYTELNELEYAYDYIFSNIWYSDIVLIINPQNGEVIRKINFSELKKFEDSIKENKPIDVLNGIAYNKENDRYVLEF